MRSLRTTRPGARPAIRLLAAVLALGLPLAGCFSETYQKGYIIPEGALEQIPIGASQEQVLIVLGTPSTVATVSGEAFYYISQRSERAVASRRTARLVEMLLRRLDDCDVGLTCASEPRRDSESGSATTMIRIL